MCTMKGRGHPRKRVKEVCSSRIERDYIGSVVCVSVLYYIQGIYNQVNYLLNTEKSQGSFHTACFISVFAYLPTKGPKIY